ncbi:SAM and SH3 domain-containing protein 1-like isoform X3 [Apostichopus japonicus]|uniref:SAM and SH3 domain-containing protein 1-like isoform X3 n=1 Tax=Stichopus japonicus TaxID=307972 RepID=UPI003AB3500D
MKMKRFSLVDTYLSASRNRGEDEDDTNSSRRISLPVKFKSKLRVSKALSSSSSSFDSIDAHTGSSTPFMSMAQNSDEEEALARAQRSNISHDRLRHNSSPDMSGRGPEEVEQRHRKMSAGQKVASTLRSLVSGKSKPNEKVSSKGDNAPEIKNAADLNLPQEEILEILNAVSSHSMTQDEAIHEAQMRALRREKEKKSKLANSIKKNFAKRVERPSEGRHKISSSEEHLLPGTSASDTSSIQDEGTTTPPDFFELSPTPQKEYSRKIYNDVFGDDPPKRAPENRVSMDSIGSIDSTELETDFESNSRRSSEVQTDVIRDEGSLNESRKVQNQSQQVVDPVQAHTNTLESNASSTSYHSTNSGGIFGSCYSTTRSDSSYWTISSSESFGARHSASVQTQTADGPPENYIAIGQVTSDYTPNPFRGHLTLKKGDLVYITYTSEDKTSGEGVCNNKKGVFKYRHIQILTEEELKDMDKEKNLKSPEAVLNLNSVKELLKRINCGSYYVRFKLLGVDTLEHFKNLSEDYLDMLGVTDDMHRLKLLTARDIIKDPDRVQNLDPELEQEFLSDSAHQDPGDGDDSGVAEDMARLQLSPRDSGCYPHMDPGADREFNLLGAEAVISEEDTNDSLLSEWGMGAVLQRRRTNSMEKEIKNINSNNSNVIGQLDWCEDGHVLRMTLPGSSTHRPLGGVPCGHEGKFGQERGYSPPLRGAGVLKSSGDITGVDLLKNHPINEQRYSTNRYERPWADGSSEDVWGTVPRHRVPHGAHSRHEEMHRQTISQLPHSPPLKLSEDSLYFRSSSLEEPLFQTQVWAGSSIHPSPTHPNTLNLSRKTRVNIKRRKSRSVSPHKRGQLRHGALSHTTVYSSPTLGLRKLGKGGRLIPTTREKLIERKLEKKLRHDGVDLRDEPYSDKMGFCGIPPALVQRYAEEIQAKLSEVADILEDIRIRSLLESGKVCFKSDHLSREAEQLVYEGRGTSISDWLTSLGLPMYIQPFFAKGWDELHILVNMEEEDLQTCGVSDPKHLRRLQTALEHLRSTYNSNHS